MTSLGVDAFEEYFRDVHGHSPFPWQRDLCAQVLSERAWPDVVDLPTASGKTAMLDIALFALAAQDPHSAWTPRRIALVVDRRIVVDQAHERALRIADALRRSAGEATRSVADRLRALTGDEAEPVLAASLRGAIPRDTSWARRPDQAVLISSTVDQVGSRLLFRGYGVTRGMLPIHAGLLGNDTLFLLDEVHLSTPFAETLRSLRQLRGQTSPEVPSAPWGVVEMSATPSGASARRFTLDPATVVNEYPQSPLAQRFGAAKTLELHKCKGTPQGFASDVVTHTTKIVQEHGAETVAVVVNRVATAQAVASALRSPRAKAQRGEGVDVVLLTSRFRPLDRDRLTADVLPRVVSGRQRGTASRPLVLVATQCIEAGADFDVDAMVTECASWDALKQRFGRVDRLGELAAAGTPAPVKVLLRPGKGADPVYGDAIQHTWTWLSSLQDLDVGIEAMQRQAPDNPEPLRTPTDHAPLLRASEMNRWVQTSPTPHADPDPALWLHGLDSPSDEVSLVWRADIQPLLDRTPAEVPLARDALGVPPSSGEALSVPIAHVRAWLRSHPAESELADVEGLVEVESPSRRFEGRPVLVVREGDTMRATAAELRPGDVVVAPCSYGGYTSGMGWHPDSTTWVPDIGDEASARARGVLQLRLHPLVWTGENPLTMSDLEAADGSAGTVALSWLKSRMASGEAPAWLGEIRALPGLQCRGDDEHLVLVGRKPIRWRNGGATADAVDSEPDTSAFTAVVVELSDHLEAVGSRAGDFARRCGLPETMAKDVALAGALHDVGKADPRFQLMLNRGDRLVAASRGRLLAKSDLAANDRAGRRLAQRMSGYPEGTRHELMSAALIGASPALEQTAHDWELVQYLVASHHGYARPFVPALTDPDDVAVSVKTGSVELTGSSRHGLAAVGSGVPERFWLLVNRYGWFHLAWLETILRLADHWVSAHEQEDAQ